MISISICCAKSTQDNKNGQTEKRGVSRIFILAYSGFRKRRSILKSNQTAIAPMTMRMTPMAANKAIPPNTSCGMADGSPASPTWPAKICESLAIMAVLSETVSDHQTQHNQFICVRKADG
jgi:hypothetical protein